MTMPRGTHYGSTRGIKTHQGSARTLLDLARRCYFGAGGISIQCPFELDLWYPFSSGGSLASALLTTCEILPGSRPWNVGPAISAAEIGTEGASQMARKRSNVSG